MLRTLALLLLALACVLPAQTLQDQPIGRTLTFDLPPMATLGSSNRCTIPMGPGWSALVSTLRVGCNGFSCPSVFVTIYSVPPTGTAPPVNSTSSPHFITSTLLETYPTIFNLVVPDGNTLVIDWISVHNVVLSGAIIDPTPPPVRAITLAQMYSGIGLGLPAGVGLGCNLSGGITCTVPNDMGLWIESISVEWSPPYQGMDPAVYVTTPWAHLGAEDYTLDVGLLVRPGETFSIGFAGGAECTVNATPLSLRAIAP